MYKVPGKDWTTHENGATTIRCPGHGGWPEVENLNGNRGEVRCQHPGCGFTDEVELEEKAPEEAEGGTIEVGASDGVGVRPAFGG